MMLQSGPGRYRYTVIFTATLRGLERFEHLDAMPPVLRARCLKTLEGPERGTVLIAGETAGWVEAPGEEQREAEGATGAGGFGRQASLSRIGLELLAVASAAALFWLLWRG
ncbi:MAG: hypothetical protein ACUVS7_17200 [Bryobacteraceae bacterium]